MCIDRINNDGNYEPNNCRWATFGESNRNKSVNVNVTIAGETMCLKDWSTKIGVKYITLHRRYREGRWPTMQLGS